MTCVKAIHNHRWFYLHLCTQHLNWIVYLDVPRAFSGVFKTGRTFMLRGRSRAQVASSNSWLSQSVSTSGTNCPHHYSLGEERFFRELEVKSVQVVFRIRV